MLAERRGLADAVHADSTPPRASSNIAASNGGSAICMHPIQNRTTPRLIRKSGAARVSARLNNTPTTFLDLFIRPSCRVVESDALTVNSDMRSPDEC
jgi:hypothetical protein